jgi:hypothetical protein
MTPFFPGIPIAISKYLELDDLTNMVSRHFAQSVLHYKVHDLKVCTMNNLFVLEWIENGSEQLLIMNCSNCVSLNSSDPPAFEAEGIYLSN